MNRIFAAALEVEEFCTSQDFRFCFIGGVAVHRWGQPRLTVDVDLTVLTGFGTEAPFVDALLSRFPGRRPDMREFALHNRVALLKSSNGVDLDISLGAMPFEERTVERSSVFEPRSSLRLTTCSAEDLIVHKAFADRTQDWPDIEGVAKRQAAHLNKAQIFRELRPLLELKGNLDVADRLRRILDSAQPKKSS